MVFNLQLSYRIHVVYFISNACFPRIMDTQYLSDILSLQVYLTLMKNDKFGPSVSVALTL